MPNIALSSGCECENPNKFIFTMVSGIRVFISVERLIIVTDDEEGGYRYGTPMVGLQAAASPHWDLLYPKIYKKIK